MRRAIRFLFKLVLIILYPVFVVATVSLAVVVFLRTNEINSAKGKYEEIRNQYIQEQESKSNLTEAVEQLGVEIKSSNEEVFNLTQQLEDSQGVVQGGLVKKDYGQITGEILPFVTGGTSISQYQLVCAENVNSTNQIYCVSVSAARKEFNLIAPVGDYYVYAQIQGSNLSENLKNYKAYYTEYAKCENNRAANSKECASTLNNRKAKVIVENGKNTSEINPINWDVENLN